MKRMWYPGQRVVICRTEDGKQGVPIRATIKALEETRAYNGTIADVTVTLDQASICHTSQGEQVRPAGYEACCLLSQLDPFVPDSAQPADWRDCLWNPSMLKENPQP